MNILKRIAPAAMAVMLATVCSVPSVFAADITIDGSGSGYSAYRLLDLTTSIKTNHIAHEGEPHTADCYNFSYTVNSKYRSILQNIATDINNDGTVSDQEIISYIEGCNTSETIQAFADTVFSNVKDLPADEIATNKIFSDVDQGYYLIAETSPSDNDAISLVMLDTAGQEDIVVKSKEGVPTLTKEVKEVNDSTGESSWGIAADYDIGDTVEFKLTGTMPENIGNYESYTYIIHDTLSANLEFIEDSLKISIDGADITSGFTVETENLNDGCSLHITFTDIKTAANINSSTKVIATYSATLSSGAPLRNTNKASLEFSNDPYTAGSTATTPDSTVAVYDYTITVNKVNEKNDALAGAQFKLMKWDNESSAYVDYVNGEQTTTEGATQFTFSGLDEGKYKLIEAIVPDGYTKAEDVEFTIISDLAVDGITALTTDNEDVTVTASTGSLSTTVQNISGTLLPTTGGSGVYLIYAAGIILLIGAAVVVIARRKKDKATTED